MTRRNAQPARSAPGIRSHFMKLFQARRLARGVAAGTVLPVIFAAPLRPSSPRHVIVYHDPAWWAGTPANGGIWSWGNEILVMFQIAHYLPKGDDEFHSYDLQQPSYGAGARSLDGGETWTFEPHPDLGNPLFKNFTPPSAPQSCPGNIDFTSPGFAAIALRDRFFTSTDRGHTWSGPWQLPSFPDIPAKSLTARTDYLVHGPHDCTFFISARIPQVNAGDYKDRAFAARTRDGGATFDFLGWMTGEPLVVRSVMPSTVRISDQHLVSVMRRRFDLDQPGPNIEQNWIDAYESRDGGRTWEFLSKVATTDRGNEDNRNGNPPALVRLDDGRLVVAYGYRGEPYGIRAKISDDNGATWSDFISLRDDARNWDLGYPRMVVRPDGRLVTVYWLGTDRLREQHIEATIWSPRAVQEQ